MAKSVVLLTLWTATLISHSLAGVYACIWMGVDNHASISDYNHVKMAGLMPPCDWESSVFSAPLSDAEVVSLKLHRQYADLRRSTVLQLNSTTALFQPVAYAVYMNFGSPPQQVFSCLCVLRMLTCVRLVSLLILLLSLTHSHSHWIHSLTYWIDSCCTQLFILIDTGSSNLGESPRSIFNIYTYIFSRL